MSFNIEPLTGCDAFGALVSDLSADAIGDPEIRKVLYDLWIDKGVVVFKGLTGLHTHLELSQIFGEPGVHPLQVGMDAPREHEVTANIDYDDKVDDLYEIDGELRGGHLPWHFDLAYVDHTNHGGILRPVLLPKHGGETGFIDRIAAHAALPHRLQERIEGLSVIHAFATDATKVKFGKRPDRCVRLSAKIQLAAKHPVLQSRIIHPLVYRQAETGLKVLNVSPWHAVAIEGMENEEGDTLLREVIDLAIRPEHAYFHKWTMDDMVLWDNWRMLHCAMGVPPGEQRQMRRTTIGGDYALGRREVTGETVAAMPS